MAVINDDTKIIPGHGPVASRKDLLAYRDMLKVAYSKLLKLKNQGLSATEAIAKNPLAELDKQWSGGIFKTDKWIDVVYPAVN